MVGTGLPPSPAPERTVLAAVRLDPAQPFLADHRLGGDPVLPVAMQLALLADAAAAAHPSLACAGVEGFRLLKGVTLPDGPVALSVAAGAPLRDGARVRLPVELRGAGRVHARATLVLEPRGGQAPRRAGPIAAGTPALGLYPEQLFHGPLFQVIEEVEGLGPTGVTVRLATGAERARLAGAGTGTFALDPLALDGVFQAAVLWTRAERGAPSLPSRLAAYRQHVPVLPPRVRAVLAVRDADAGTATFDAELLGDDGTAVATLEGYVCAFSPTLERAYRNERPAATA